MRKAFQFDDILIFEDKIVAVKKNCHEKVLDIFLDTPAPKIEIAFESEEERNEAYRRIVSEYWSGIIELQ